MLLAADYSQLELRMIAHLSQDSKLIKILNGDGDVFKLITAQWKSISVEEVTPEQRQQAKQVSSEVKIVRSWVKQKRPYKSKNIGQRLQACRFNCRHIRIIRFFSAIFIYKRGNINELFQKLSILCLICCTDLLWYDLWYWG